MVGVSIAACGGSEGSNEPTYSYDEVLHGLTKAAFSGGAYPVADHTNGLDVAQREVVRSFCKFAWQIGINREAWKLDYPGFISRRIRSGAFVQGNAPLPSIRVALHELDDVVDLHAINPKRLKLYTDACYR